MLESTRDLGSQISPDHLAKVSRSGLLATQQLELISKLLPGNHPLREIVDELSDRLEAFAESLDPETARYIEGAREEALRNELVPLEQVDITTT